MTENVLKLHRLYEAEFQLNPVHCSEEEIEAMRLGIPPEILVRYDSLKQRFGPSVLVPVEHDSCSACHMGISERRRKAVEHDVSDCESCGRLLYDQDIVLNSMMALRDRAFV